MGRLLRAHIVRICAIVCAQLPKIVASALIASVYRCVFASVCAGVCVVLAWESVQLKKHCISASTLHTLKMQCACYRFGELQMHCGTKGEKNVVKKK